MKTKLYITVSCILNLIYSFIGALIQIAYAMTLPNSEKFDDGPIGNLWILLLVIVHFLGEIIFLKFSYSKFFKDNKKQFVIYAIVNLIVYFMLLWISLITCIVE